MATPKARPQRFSMLGTASAPGQAHFPPEKAQLPVGVELGVSRDSAGKARLAFTGSVVLAHFDVDE